MHRLFLSCNFLLGSRREIIEDLLDIRIFSTMNVILKDRLKVANEEIKENETAIKFLKEKQRCNRIMFIV